MELRRKFSRTAIANFDQDTPRHPYLTFTLGPGELRRLVVKIWSNDQGHASNYSDSNNPYGDSHTWFSFGILQETQGCSKTTEENLFEFQRNVRASGVIRCYTNEWIIGLSAEEDNAESEVLGFLESLAQIEGLEIGVFPLARYPAWVNTVWQMEIEVHSIQSDYHADMQDDKNKDQVQKSTRHSRSARVLQEEEMAELAQVAVDATSQSDPHAADQLAVLGYRLATRFQHSGSLHDIDLAVKFMKVAVKGTLQGHPKELGRSIDLAACFGKRYDLTGSQHDLTHAIDILEVAVRVNPHIDITEGCVDQASILNNLGNCLGMRYTSLGKREDLDRAIEFLDTAVAITPNNHPAHVGRLNNLGNWLAKRATYTHSLQDLDRAIQVTDMAVAATRQAHPKYASLLTNLGNRLGARFSRIGSTADLSRAIEAAEMAVDATPHGHGSRANRLNNLGSLLRIRFERNDSMEDLAHAIRLINTGIEMTSEDVVVRAGLLGNLGDCLGKRFGRLGSMDDLNQAVEMLGKAVEQTPSGHLDGIARMNSLGNMLAKRHERTGSIADIDRAIQTLEMATNITPEAHSYRAILLANLSACLVLRFHRSHSDEDINRAVGAMDQAIGTTPEEHPDYANFLVNLGNSLGIRHLALGSTDDINRAVKTLDQAVAATPSDHSSLALRLNNLGKWLSIRSKCIGQTGDDLNRAIEALTRAVDTIPLQSHDRAALMMNLGNCFGTRFERTSSADDLNSQLSYYIQGWDCRNSPPSSRILQARGAATILAVQSRWEEASELLQGAVDLLPAVSPRSLKNTDQQHMLSNFGGLASEAAASLLNAGKAPDDALRILELGRGVISGLLLETRTEVTDLSQSHPELAKEFESLRDELDSSSDELLFDTANGGLPSWEQQAKRQREADKQFREVVAKIRADPEFRNFLLPPSKQELMSAACSGPIVVVNTSYARCDAFLIDSHTIQLLPLPGLKHSDFDGKMQSSPALLEGLWNSIARPALDKLGFLDSPRNTSLRTWPHVWWVLTGSLSRLPIHAAGRHEGDSSDTVIDRVVSSYSTSIRTLIHSRQNSSQKNRQSSTSETLLVSMRTTPSKAGFAPGELMFAEEEVQTLDSLLSPSVPTMTLTQPTKVDILKHIESCTVFHFAGHGISDPLDPSKSCLLLDDWVGNPLTVEDLTSLKLFRKSPWLAYLSACSTGESQANDLQDESIHLASACQLAGFPHVVGSLWMIDDEYSSQAAREVYKTIQDLGWADEAVALGVHSAARHLRRITGGGSWLDEKEGYAEYGKSHDGQSKTIRPPPDQESVVPGVVRGSDCAVRNEGNPSIWAAYIHVGP